MPRTLSLLVLFLVTPLPIRAQDPKPSPSPDTTTQAPSFPAQIEVVTVDAVVTDKKGKPIADLSKDDFTLFEDGDAQTITSFEAIHVPAAPSTTPPPRPRVSTNTVRENYTGRTFMIVFDDIHMSPMQAHRAKGAVSEFLKKGVREGDRVTLVATGGDAWWSTRMMSGSDELIALLKRMDGRLIPDLSPDRMSDYEAMRIHVFRDPQVMERVARRFEQFGVNLTSSYTQQDQYSEGDPLVLGRATEIYYQALSRNRITLQVLERVVQSLAATKGRKSVVLVSEGFIYDSNMAEFKQVLQASRRANAAIYFLDTRGLSGMSTYASAEFGPPLDSRDVGASLMENIEASEGSESLASESGGFTVKNTNDLAAGIQRIADESRTYYLLGYNPTNVAEDGRYRKIEVKVNRKDVKVRARKGYYARLPGGQDPLAKKNESSDPDIQAALDSPFEETDIPLRMTSYVFGETLLGKANVVVATDVDVSRFAFEQQDGRFNNALEFLLVVAHRESGEYFRYDQKVEMKLRPETRERFGREWYTVARDFELAPGAYQAKIVVRDANDKKIGTVIHEFEVPDLTKFRVSSPVISDTLQQPSAGEDPTPHPALLARRTFASGTALYCSFEVFGAEKDKKSGMPEVTAGYRIRRKDGYEIMHVAPTLIRPTSLGKLNRLIGTTLQNAQPGDYELVLDFKDLIAGKSLEVAEPFTVVPPAPATQADAGS